MSRDHDSSTGDVERPGSEGADDPIPVPPGEEPPAPVEEPPDSPNVPDDPDPIPEGDPGTTEPTRYM